VDAMPDTIRGAVLEYADYGRQPIPLISCSALGAVSLACQGHADVARDAMLSGPSGVYLMLIGVSGERKTASDNHLTSPLRDWLNDFRKKMEPEIKASKANHDAWEAKRKGILRLLENGSRGKLPKDKTLHDIEVDLVQLAQEEPRIIKPPELFHYDFNPASLGGALSDGYPISSIWTAEGGAFVGNHGNQSETFLSSMAMINTLWDNGSYHNQRKTTASIHIDNIRLTACLMMQPDVFRHFNGLMSGMARGIGLFGRFLIAWPKSTIGTRTYKAPPEGQPHYTKFAKRLTDCLKQPLPIHDGTLIPTRMHFDPSAFELWREYHDVIEKELGPLGDFADAKDLGSKMAENAARLACLFHVFENGPGGMIPAASMKQAIRIASWHLSEGKRVFGLTPKSEADDRAHKLLMWLVEHDKAKDLGIPNGNPFKLTTISQYGPSVIRSKDSRDKALKELKDYSWIFECGKQYHLNPMAKQFMTVNPVT